MLFSLHIIYDYIILDDNVLNIVNKNIGTEKKKMTGGKKKQQLCLSICMCQVQQVFNKNTHL